MRKREKNLDGLFEATGFPRRQLTPYFDPVSRVWKAGAEDADPSASETDEALRDATMELDWRIEEMESQSNAPFADATPPVEEKNGSSVCAESLPVGQEIPGDSNKRRGNAESTSAAVQAESGTDKSEADIGPDASLARVMTDVGANTSDASMSSVVLSQSESTSATSAVRTKSEAGKSKRAARKDGGAPAKAPKASPQSPARRVPRDDGMLGGDLPPLPDLKPSAIARRAKAAPSAKALHERLYNAIEMALVKLHPNTAPDAMMARLRDRFPASNSFLDIPMELMEDLGMDEHSAFFFSMIPELTRRLSRAGFSEQGAFDSFERLSEYLRTLYIGVRVERFYMILLDARGRMLDTVLLSEGTRNRTEFLLRNAVAAAVNGSAQAMVLCHNHPGGTPWASREDVDCTLQMLQSLAPLGVWLLDHVIIAGDRAVSVRATSQIGADLWLMQAPHSALLRNWMR